MSLSFPLSAMMDMSYFILIAFYEEKCHQYGVYFVHASQLFLFLFLDSVNIFTSLHTGRTFFRKCARHFVPYPVGFQREVKFQTTSLMFELLDVIQAGSVRECNVVQLRYIKQLNQTFSLLRVCTMCHRLSIAAIVLQKNK